MLCCSMCESDDGDDDDGELVEAMAASGTADGKAEDFSTAKVMIQVNGGGGGGAPPPLKSCMKQSSPRPAPPPPLHEPLLGNQDDRDPGDGDGDGDDACNKDGSFFDGDGDRFDGEERAGGEEMIDEECTNREEQKKNVQWSQDIAEVREYEQSDREDDGCYRHRDCKCTIQ